MNQPVDFIMPANPIDELVGLELPATIGIEMAKDLGAGGCSQRRVRENKREMLCQFD